VFGMYSSQDEMETFDVEDEAAPAVWDHSPKAQELIRQITTGLAAGCCCCNPPIVPMPLPNPC
jgi:hypothetical protein